MTGRGILIQDGRILTCEKMRKRHRKHWKLSMQQRYAEKSFEAISDGQEQRILPGRAICQEPEVLILDEPFFLDIRYKLGTYLF